METTATAKGLPTGYGPENDGYEQLNRTPTGVTYARIRYHIVMVPRYKRKIFAIAGLKEQMEKQVREGCEEMGCTCSDFLFGDDWMSLVVTAMPQTPSMDVIKAIRKFSKENIKENFKDLKSMYSVWTQHYLISTEHVDDPVERREIAEEYAKRQPNHG